MHIVCFNVPYPVDYGGVYDLFYKLPALKQQGVKIHLHCFEYGRGHQPALNEYCEEVFYYKRLKGLAGLSFRLPYIVASRRNKTLLNRLASDNYPILMEGVHCTYLLNDKRFADRKCFLRLHNVEYLYYKNLYKFSGDWFKKLYYLSESQRLLDYEKEIASKATVLTVIPKDGELYKQFGATKIKHLPLFLPVWKVNCNGGIGTFCLYHGDLSVEENDNAAQWVLQQVFAKLDMPFVIAGKNPSAKLKTLANSKNNICIVSNPSEEEMQDMIEKAHINILPSFNNTGIKLKLINALFNGRHCVVNDTTVEGTHLEACCVVATDAVGFTSAVTKLIHQPFTEEDCSLRKKLLDNMFNNEANAKRLVELIWR